MGGLYRRQNGNEHMKVAVFGSRGLPVPDLKKYLSAGITEIFSGGAQGIDMSAREYTLANRIKLTRFLPKYEKQTNLRKDLFDNLIYHHPYPKPPCACRYAKSHQEIHNQLLKAVFINIQKVG